MTDVQWKDIVKEEKRYCAHIKKTFEGPVLGYITPVSLRLKKLHLNWCCLDVMWLLPQPRRNQIVACTYILVKWIVLATLKFLMRIIGLINLL